MNSLKKFLGAIKVADRPISEQCEAFYMDGGRRAREKPDMRTHVGLGSCHCCDYFLIHEQNILLIEETRLLQRKKNLEKECSYLNERDREDFIKKQLLQQNYLKVYGAMLVLCRLAAKFSDVKKELENKDHYFWLVVSELTPDDIRYFENFSITLRQALKSVLTSQLLGDVKVLPAYKLKENLESKDI